MNQPPVRPGDILARKYRVDRVLGAGNMGVVVAATHVDLGQRVALKHMLGTRSGSAVLRERFLREARAAVRLRSQHVARVLDVSADENEAPYIVMEFLEGQDLAALLNERKQLPFEDAVEFVLQACEAMGEAHAAGIVHRDLKPANLFLTHDVGGAPCVKVLDFGVSKLSDADVALTHESQALGSPLYMSPEQMNSSRSVDARSDVWALGVILYQLVAGLTPFDAQTLSELYSRVLLGPPTPLEHYRRDVPPGFEAVILRCLEKDRARRFQDVAELAAALGPYAPPRARAYVERVWRAIGMKEARAGSMPEMPVAPTVGMQAQVAQTMVLTATGGEKRSVRAPILAVFALVALVSLVAFVAVWKGGTSAEPPTAGPAGSAASSMPAPAAAAPVETSPDKPVVTAPPSVVPSGAASMVETTAAAPSATASAKPVATVKQPGMKATGAPRPVLRKDDLYNP
jgi:serine/threonine-protein kinase